MESTNHQLLVNTYPDEFITCPEAAKLFRTSQQTIRRWILTGVINPDGCFQIGKRGRWRIYKSALEKAKIFADGGFDSKWMNKTFASETF